MFSTLISRRTRLRRMAAGVAAVAVCSLALPGSAEPGATGAGGVPGADKVPAQGTYALQYGGATMTQSTVANAPKMIIEIGPDAPMVALLYVSLWNFPAEDPTRFLPYCVNRPVRVPCVPDPFEQPPCADPADPDSMLRGVYWRNAVFAVDAYESGGFDPGMLAKVPVNMVAFGSIPAQATLTLRQVEQDGKPEPFIAQLWAPSRVSNCDPGFRTKRYRERYGGVGTTTVVTGKFNIFISDLKLDGVAVDLAPTCRTQRPVDLMLFNEVTDSAQTDYAPAGGGPLGAYDGLHPGSDFVVDLPEAVEFNGKKIPASTGLSIPPFAGCTSGADDLTPLITSMASGPNNPVRVKQSLGTVGDELPLDDPTKCVAGRCPVPPEVPDAPPIPKD